MSIEPATGSGLVHDTAIGGCDNGSYIGDETTLDLSPLDSTQPGPKTLRQSQAHPELAGLTFCQRWVTVKQERLK
jgi:hypothetical protein